jgi:2-polyprenyl-6-methoxyphenol hydroxylase-like FAD-dependent oxidoreductase
MDQHSPSAGPPHFLDGKTVLVSGAGIAGLAFAVALAQRFADGPNSTSQPKVIILERDSYEERVGREGYTLSLRTDNNVGGGQVLDRLGLYERVRKVSVNAETGGEGGGCFNIWGPDIQHPLLRLATAPVGTKRLTGMRIRRNALQRALAQAAADSGAEIRWESAVIDARSTEDGRMELSLANGSAVLGDVLIAADGSRSKLGSLLRTDHDLQYAGVYCWSGVAKYASRDSVPKPVNRDWGLTVGAKDGVGLFVSPVDETSALWSFSRRSSKPKETLRYPIAPERLDELMEASTDLAANFAPIVKNLVSATDPRTVMFFNALDRQPFSHSLSETGSVIYVGDANHAVSPFAGAGANLALMDAWDLAGALESAPNLQEAVAAYDKAALPRASTTLKMSRWVIDFVHATGIRLLLYKLAVRILGFFVRRGASA